jgi:glycosyltransferase involved in cell wall biosynthesis
MQFSVIVCTVGRIPELRAFLRGLAAQTSRDFETIVVDQSGASDVRALCDAFHDGIEIKHVAMSGRGLSRARNRGFASVGGEIVTFADDDCVYPPHLLAEIRDMLSERPELHGVSVRSENEEGTASVTRFDREPGRLTKENMFSKFIEFGLFIRRNVIAHEPFDELMGIGAGTPWSADEGLDLVIRLLRKDVNIEYRPDLVIIHPAPQMNVDKSIIRRQYNYGCGRGRLFRKHRFPPRVVLYSMCRSLGGAFLMLACLRLNRARAHAASFRGKLRGWVAPGL